jgi:cyanate permease
MDAQSSGRTTRQVRPTTGALAVTAILLLAINWRPGIVSVGSLLPSIINDFRLSHTAASLLVSIPDVLMGAVALPTPWLARRFERDAVILGVRFVWKAFVLTVRSLIAGGRSFILRSLWNVNGYFEPSFVLLAVGFPMFWVTPFLKSEPRRA